MSIGTFYVLDQNFIDWVSLEGLLNSLSHFVLLGNSTFLEELNSQDTPRFDFGIFHSTTLKQPQIDFKTFQAISNNLK
jgi:hypothetical protein